MLIKRSFLSRFFHFVPLVLCAFVPMYPLSHPKPDKFVIPQPSGGVDPNGLSKLRPYVGRDLVSRHFATQQLKVT